jgi:hypothetical protein
LSRKSKGLHLEELIGKDLLGSSGFEERFWSKVDRRAGDECWLWSGAIQGAGYGMIWCRSRRGPVLAHMASYVLEHGDIEPGMEVIHSCDTPHCVNPAHLKQATHAENLADAARKRRMSSGPEHRRKVLAGMRLGERHPRAKLSDQQVLEIRQRKAAGETDTELGREFGVSRALIYKLHLGKARQHSPGLKEA